MSSNSVCNHTCDIQIVLPLRGRPILLSLVWLPNWTPLGPITITYLFLHQDAYKCFPFIIFPNINAPIIIIRKPTLFLCLFHNNDNKCFVGYFWKFKKEFFLFSVFPCIIAKCSQMYLVNYILNELEFSCYRVIVDEDSRRIAIESE